MYEQLNELKQYLRVDTDLTEDDNLILSLADTAIAYIEQSTGKKYVKDNILDLTIKQLVAHWYENRKIMADGNYKNNGSELPYAATLLIKHIALSGAYEVKT